MSAKNNALGVKGCGEAGATGSPPAAINALLNALRPIGIRHVDMPATPDKLWRSDQASETRIGITGERTMTSGIDAAEFAARREKVRQVTVKRAGL